MNFLLFGTSFTRQPRLDGKALADLNSVVKTIQARIADLLAALALPQGDERRRLFGALIKRHARAEPRRYLLSLVARARAQQKEYAAEELKARSTLFQNRGLSLDTSILPAYAVHRILAELHAKHDLETVRRVAIVGPGLDLIDKQAGYDFYPPQSIQPFALIDSLVRLHLANLRDLSIAVFEISPVLG